ncbi:MAG: hypothetical protein LLF75_06125 [Eubacteriales bacterium]|nr:hypothetical protein [Eubacteriales bacterium]
MEASGKGMIYTASALFVFMGVIFLVMVYMALGMSSLLAPLIGNAFGILGELLDGNLVVIFLILAAVCMTLGIFGINWGGKPEKALFFIITGSILTIYNVFLLITAFSVWPMFSLFLSLPFLAGGLSNI